jgi:hypothetical protein
MVALQHLFMAGIRADTEVEYAIQGSRRIRWADLHITQSELDGACGIVAVLQSAMVLLGVKRKDVEKIASIKSGPLHTLWNLARRDYFTGTTEQELERLIGVFAPRLRSKTVLGSNTRLIAKEIGLAIEAGHVPILGIHSRTWRHWVLAIGVEIETGKSRPRALLCLDPSDSRPELGVFYTARCALQASEYGLNGKAKKYALRYSNTDGQVNAVQLHGLVIVKRGQAP